MSAVPEPTLLYRPMHRDDLDQVLEIEQRIYPFPWSRGNFADSLAAGYLCTVVEHARAPIGYGILSVAAGESHLLNLSIDAPWQRHGYGRAALIYHVHLARGQGARILLLEVRPSNTVARSLYDSAGFERVGSRRAYYPAHGGREDALVLALSL
ncbi:MAG: ribosomal protein S18-alanine N-acetyltransferase [Burkholderiales bacterium]|nr:ribosomal protein S18-alanine N-acetyltransferase [Burkholderiales bacterium]